LELPRKRAAEVNVEVPNAARHLGKRRKLADPIHLIRGLSFCGKLRSVREFTNTLNLAHDFDHPNEPRRNQDNDPSRTTLDVARQKADVISMLLSRREFRADALFDRIESINVFTDSSPIVGGELQGMIIDVCKTDPADNHRLILPGSSLCYSHFDAVSKTIGLLWALWLVGGPDETTLRYLLTKIGSTCTDMGIEHMTLQCPDVLQAFLSWGGGRSARDLSYTGEPRQTATRERDQARRLVPRSGQRDVNSFEKGAGMARKTREAQMPH